MPNHRSKMSPKKKKKRLDHVHHLVPHLRKLGAEVKWTERHHLIVLMPDGRRVDWWPSTSKYQVEGGSIHEVSVNTFVDWFIAQTRNPKPIKPAPADIDLIDDHDPQDAR